VTGLWPDENSPDAEAERAALEKALAESDVAVVVLIDELDRVEDDEVRAVAQLVKAIGEIKGISYLVAYDPERVADALGRGEGAERRSSGQAYLEKIIHLPIPLRPLEREDIEALLHQALTAHAKPLPARTKHYQSAILEQILQQIETPRDVKRLTQSFAVFETIVKGDICPYDVMAYCWLIIKFPSAHKIIRENLHYLVFDPESQMQIKQYLRKLDGKAEPTLMGIFTPDYAAYEPLLQQLFPHFSKSISDRDEGFMLAKRRNLRRMLYLGNPPGQIPRAEIESLWNAPDANEIKRRLDDYVASGKIMDVLERLPDLSDRLLESHDIEFWKHLADLLYRKTDWITAQQPFAQIAREAAEAMRLMAWRDRPGSPRHLNCIMSLQRSGDLILVPQLLYWNIRAHRLDARAGHQDERETLSEDITARLIADEVPRYRSAVLNGTVLRRLPTLDVVFALMQAGAWDEEMRLSLNSQLTDFTSIATFAALLFPPGFGEPFETLNDIVVVHDLDLKTRTLEMPSDHAGDSWLWASVKRLKAVIAREVSSA
jgi:hypothetical protein